MGLALYAPEFKSEAAREKDNLDREVSTGDRLVD